MKRAVQFLQSIINRNDKRKLKSMEDAMKKQQTSRENHSTDNMPIRARFNIFNLYNHKRYRQTGVTVYFAPLRYFAPLIMFVNF